jgi:predicted DNA-binding transcriptional regulator YafY
MTKTDRLAGILLLLQDRPLSARELALHFEVSRRTIIRDAEALLQIGVPLISQDGAGGGYSLPDDYSMPPLQLTRQEAFLLLFALDGVQKLGSAPFASSWETLVAKLRQVIPASKRDEAEKLTKVVKFSMVERDKPAPFLEPLIAAARNRDWLNVEYCSYNGVSDQIVQPHRIHAANGLWYCDAFSHTRGEQRTYRVDRFLAISNTIEPEAKTTVKPLPYDDPSHPQVEIELTPKAVMMVETEPHFGHRITMMPDGSGKLEFRCPPSEFGWLARYLLSLGENAKVLGPRSLQTQIRDLAEKIISTYPER